MTSILALELNTQPPAEICELAAWVPGVDYCRCECTRCTIHGDDAVAHDCGDDLCNGFACRPGEDGTCAVHLGRIIGPDRRCYAGRRKELRKVTAAMMKRRPTTQVCPWMSAGANERCTFAADHEGQHSFELDSSAEEEGTADELERIVGLAPDEAASVFLARRWPHPTEALAYVLLEGAARMRSTLERIAANSCPDGDCRGLAEAALRAAKSSPQSGTEGDAKR